jgi:hypothetical protein
MSDSYYYYIDPVHWTVSGDPGIVLYCINYTLLYYIILYSVFVEFTSCNAVSY